MSIQTLHLVLSQQWQPRVFLGMIPQAWHTFLLEVSPSVLGRIAEAQRGWMRRVMLQVVVFLKCKPSPQPEILDHAGKGFHSHYIFLHPSSPPSWQVSPSFVAEQHPHSMILPLCLTVGIVLMRWCSVPGFLHTRHVVLWPNSSIFVSDRTRGFSQSGAFLAPSRLLCAF